MKPSRVIVNLAGAALFASILAAIWWSGRPLVRREIHSEPLIRPITVSDVDAQGVHTADGRILRIAGIAWPPPPEQHSAREAANTFCKPGVELTQVFADGSAAFTIEARVCHTCGNDPIAAHYDRWDLAELLVGSGLVMVDEQDPELPAVRLKRLLAFEQFSLRRREERGASWGFYVNRWGLRPGFSGELKEFRRDLDQQPD